MVENTDIETPLVPELFRRAAGAAKEMDITSVDVEGCGGNGCGSTRSHEKYVILYCHGGGYSTGSCVFMQGR